MSRTREVKLYTLCLVTKEDRVLLGLKKRGFGEGRWNGFGGKVNLGESITGAAVRELHEEVGITATAFEKKGILHFEFESDPLRIMEVHVFQVTAYEGQPAESEEMKPEWFPVSGIPYEKMWSDDKYWLPLLLAGKKFKGYFLFDQPSSATYSAKILKENLETVTSI